MMEARFSWIGSLVITTLALVLSCYSVIVSGEMVLEPCSISAAERHRLKEKAKEMFYHGYNAYKKHAMPRDQLASLSCSGLDEFGGIALTLIDAMDTLAVFGDWEEFVWAVKYVEDNVSWDKNVTVSLFETNIRVLGGLLAAHEILTEASMEAGFNVHKWYPSYDGALLRLAVDLADRFMGAFDTTTGIPFGSVHLQHGVSKSETPVASTAGAGTLLLEFGTLSRLTGNHSYYNAAFRAMSGLWERRASTYLVGNHINTKTGVWTAREAGIGGLIDSYYEYMLKGFILFGDSRLLQMFRDAYAATQKHLRIGAWYVDVEMEYLGFRSASHSSLAAYFYGLQILYGDIDPAVTSFRGHYGAWRRYGCLPEGYLPNKQQAAPGQVNYPLRPELIESAFYLHWATNDSSWIAAARNMMYSINYLTRTSCGFARILEAATHELEDGMDSFFLSETTKYLYLTFDADHWLRQGHFVFTTEAHPLLITAQFSPNASLSTAPEGESLAEPLIQKCKRRRHLDTRSACGFGMPGSDLPALNLTKFINNVEETFDKTEGATDNTVEAFQDAEEAFQDAEEAFDDADEAFDKEAFYDTEGAFDDTEAFDNTEKAFDITEKSLGNGQKAFEDW